MTENAATVESFLTLVPLRRLIQLNGIRGYRDSAESRHRMVMALFPIIEEEQARAKMAVLFRGERTKEESSVLIRSAVRPSNLPGIKTLRENFTRFDEQAAVRFRVTVSALKRSGDSERWISEFTELEGWLTEKLQPGLKELDLIQLKDEEIRRAGAKSFVKLTQIDGTAKIGDLEILEKLLRGGVGRNKSYGAGLLTLAAL